MEELGPLAFQQTSSLSNSPDLKAQARAPCMAGFMLTTYLIIFTCKLRNLGLSSLVSWGWPRLRKGSV